jgi:hypothetical protein
MYWIKTGWACGGVIVKDDVIIDAAPIFKRFIGQPIINILNWKQVNQWKYIQLST